MRVRYHLGIGVFMLLCGLFTLTTGLLLGAANLMLIGGINTLVGLGMLVQPMFVVNDRTVEAKNMLGMTMKVHSFEGLHALQLNKRKLIVPTLGGPKKLGGFFARPSDIAVVAEAIATATTPAAAENAPASEMGPANERVGTAAPA